MSNIFEEDIKKTEIKVTFVWREKGSIIGYLNLHENNQFNQPGDAMLEVFVDPQCQGKGIGSKLIKQSIEYASNHPTFERIILGVLHSNIEAIKLYENLEFKDLRKDIKGKFMGLIP